MPASAPVSCTYLFRRPNNDTNVLRSLQLSEGLGNEFGAAQRLRRRMYRFLLVGCCLNVDRGCYRHLCWISFRHGCGCGVICPKKCGKYGTRARDELLHIVTFDASFRIFRSVNIKKQRIPTNTSTCPSSALNVPAHNLLTSTCVCTG